MCLLFFYINRRANVNQYKLILVNNRDEFYSRPAEKSQIWGSNPRIVSGVTSSSFNKVLCLLEKILHFSSKNVEIANQVGKVAIWLGASETGKISCLLNIFQPIDAFKQNTTGRGFLALNFLQNNFSSQDYVNTIKESNINYNLFNLLLLEYRRNSYEALYFNNVDNTSTNLDTDVVHGFGNCLISNDFKKIEKGKEFFWGGY
ncbi:hypothetical protein Avbf_05304 [Armadillidium vulgare]|nr:hypothetical protein Avbf_05304 [Armadillidium vulgare]